MAGASATRIATTLRIPAARLAALDHHAEADVAVLADAVDAAVQAQTAELDAALEKALRFIPRPLRGRARSLLFPGGRDG